MRAATVTPQIDENDAARATVDVTNSASATNIRDNRARERETQCEER